MAGDNDVEPQGLTAHEKELMKKCAHYVSQSCDTARFQSLLGKRVEWSLGGGSAVFGFLNANHPHNSYYQYLLSSYTKQNHDAKTYYAKFYAQQSSSSEVVPSNPAYASKGSSDFHVATQKVEAAGNSNYYYSTTSESQPYTLPSGRTTTADPATILREAEERNRNQTADEKRESRSKVAVAAADVYAATYGVKRARSSTPSDEE